MNWNFSAWSIRNPMPPVLLFIVLMALGVMSFMKLPVTRFPNIDIPIVAVTVGDPGVAPSELETQITKRIEDAVANVTGANKVMSNITEGRSTTVIEFRLDMDTQTAVNDVKDAVERIRSDLPASSSAPVVNRIDVEGQAIITYAISSKGMTLEELSWFADDTVIRKLQGLKGVAQVDRYGGATREIRVSLDAARMDALGVTAANVNTALRASNLNTTGGRSDAGGREQSIRLLGAAGGIDELAALQVPISGGRSVRLSDIADVADHYSEPRSFARVNGQTVVALGIFRGKGESDVEVFKRVSAAIGQLETAWPDVAFSLVDETVTYTKGNYSSAMESLIEGAILAVIVVFIFLRDWRATLISAFALPLSVIPTFWALSLLGFSLNLVSLLGVTLVTGILVDDAIVEIENIARHIRMGKSPWRAALEAADEIGLAVIAISATIIAVFAPVSFMGGIAGQYFKQFGLTVAIAVFFSLLVARLITPLMAAYFMRPHPEAEGPAGPFMRLYTRLLDKAIRFRWTTLLLGVLFFAGSIYATRYLPSGFMPRMDASRILFSVELPPGARLDDTRAATDEIANVMRSMPEVENVFVIGGSNPLGTIELRRATVIADLKHKSERDLSQDEIEQLLLDKLAAVPDVRAYFVNDRGSRALEIGIMAEDGEALAIATRKIQGAMAATGKFRAVTSNAALDRPEILLTPRPERLAELGLSTAAISEAVRVATIGDIDANLAKFTVGDRQIPIRVELGAASRDDISVLTSLPIPAPSGVVVPLSSIADIAYAQGPSSIQRFNRERRIVIGADMAAGFEIGEGLAIVKALPEVKSLPAGMRLQETGDAEVMGDVFAGFRDAMITGLMLVLVVLVLLFGSAFHTFTILMSLPLSIGGVVGALWLADSAISMPVVIGILMLMGIVTKNAIMLVDFAIERMKDGMSRRDAIVDAGAKRARPIVMTTIAMSAGMVPAALALGDGGEFRAPMAIAVMGGLLVATFLSLLFVPPFFTIMDDVRIGAGKLMSRFLNPNAPDEPDASPDAEIAVIHPRGPLREAAE